MDSQVVNHHDHVGTGTHQGGEEEDHHEKKSYMQKVKDKAKKIKNTLKGHAQGDEEDEDDGPDVHGASATPIGSGVPGQGDNLKVPNAKFGDTIAEHDYEDPVRAGIKTGDPIRDNAPNLERTDPMKDPAHENTRQAHSGASGVTPKHDDVRGHEQNLGQQNVKHGRTSVKGEGLHNPQNTPVTSFKEHKSNVTDPSHTFHSGTEVDRKANPQAYTPSNHQTKVDPTNNAGGKEVGVAPILHSFDQMNIHGGRGTDQKSSHDQFCAENPTNQGSSYTEKMSSAKSAIADKDTSAKNVVASKLGYDGNNDDQHEDSDNQKVTVPTNAGKQDQSSYYGKISSAIADKAVSGKNVVFSTLGYGGNNEQSEDIIPTSTNAETGAVEVAIKPVAGAEQKSHQDQPSNQGSSYTERISSTISPVANTVVSAKNVVASKLGYGGDNEQHDQDVTEKSGGAGNDQHDKSATSPIGDKAISAKNAVASKLGYGGNNDQHDQEYMNNSGEEARHQPGATGGDYNKARPDKGASLKGYFAEKLKPGEEDRALSEVISETLHKGKAEHSDGTKPVAEVTESEEVSQRLGPDYGTEHVEQSSYGKVVADAFKGAVGSLFGKADQTTTSPQSLGSSTGTEGFSSSGSGAAERLGHSEEQRRLEGSGN